MTLQSGQVVDLPALAQAVKEQGGGCCVPRSTLGDFTPITKMEGSGGTFFVSADPDCNVPLTAVNYPSTFEAINVCGKTAGGVDGGVLRAAWCVALRAVPHACMPDAHPADECPTPHTTHSTPPVTPPPPLPTHTHTTTTHTHTHTHHAKQV
jgi:hypothetical protein